MKKYQDLLLANINLQLEEWLESGDAQVSHVDLHRFLHSITGTAGTIGLPKLSQIARQRMLQLEDLKPGYWSPESVRNYLFDLIQLSFHIKENEVEAEYITPVTMDVTPSMEQLEQPIILVLDDDAAFLMYMKDELEKRGYMVLAATHSEQAIEYVHNYRPDCLVLDLHAKDAHGFEVMSSLSVKIKQEYLPTTIVSADDRVANRIKAYQMGADDFVSKPLNMEEFAARIERQLSRKQMFEHRLIHDELTGAHKRKSLEESYRIFANNCQSNGTPFYFSMIDLLHLKSINRQFGYLSGDRALQYLASIIQDNLSPADLLIRYSGSSFVLMGRHDGSPQEIRRELEGWLLKFGQHEIVGPDEQRFYCKSSFGLLVVDHPDQSLEQLLNQVRQMIEEAKSAGQITDGNVLPNMLPKEAINYVRTLKVAIVDDDAVVRTLLTEYVKSCFPVHITIDVRVYRDGEDFFEDSWCKDEGPYFIILDQMMPRMDGMEVLQRLRSSSESDQYTILILTGKKTETDIVKALQLGADDYVTKPFSLKELEARISNLARRLTR